jgi:hypothetical protein
MNSTQQWEAAMLAEIFLLKLEFMVQQGAAERVLSNQTRYVPIKLPFRFRAVRRRT